MIKLLLLTILIANPALKPRETIKEIPKKHGHWVMEESGKAIWCEGPTIVIIELNGKFSHYGTKCIGKYGSIIKLHD
jgi:hypothetical protein